MFQAFIYIHIPPGAMLSSLKRADEFSTKNKTLTRPNCAYIHEEKFATHLASATKGDVVSKQQVIATFIHGARSQMY